MNQLTLDEMQVLAVVNMPRKRDDIVFEVTSRWPSTKSGDSTVRATISSLVSRGLLAIDGSNVVSTTAGTTALESSFGHVRSLFQSMGRTLGVSTWS